jgi:hypothetical protein
VHFFNENTPLFDAIARLAALRRRSITLRRGRQFMHDVSGDGVHFGPPKKLGDRLHTLISWSRVMGDHEMLVVFNTDAEHGHEIYSTLNPRLRKEGEQLELLFSYDHEHGVESVEAPRYAPPRLIVERHGDVLCTRLALGPAGFAIYSASAFHVRIGT